jgi:PST family polysaccharide transporter
MNREDHFRTPTPEDLRSRTVAGAAVTLTAQIVGNITQLIGSVVLARILSPNDFGLVLMVAAFSGLLMNFGVNGFTEAVIQQPALQHRQVNSLFWINAACSSSLTVVFMALGPVIARFYGEPDLIPITVIMAFSILFGGLSTQHMALLKRRMRFHSAVGNEVTAWVLSYVLAVVLALSGFGYWSLVARQVAFTVALCAGGWILCGWRPGFPSWGGEVGGMVRFALSTYGTFIMAYFERNLDKVLIGRFQGTRWLGSYERAYTLFSIPAGQLTIPLTNVSIAALSRLRGDPLRYRQAFLRAVSLVAFLGMPAGAILTVVGYDMILLLLGPKWEQAGVIFTIFAPAAGLYMVSSTQGWLHLSLGKANRWFRWSMVAFLITSILFVAGLSYGATGVAVGRLVAIHLLAVPGLWYAGRPIHLKIRSVIAVTWKYYVSSAFAGLLTWAVLQNLAPSGGTWELHALRLLLGSTICLALYLASTIALHQGLKPIVDFLLILRESWSGLRLQRQA